MLLLNLMMNMEKNIRFVDAGTSYSTPIVSGVVACLMSENPYVKVSTEITKKKKKKKKFLE